MKSRRFDVPFGSDTWISLALGLMFFITSLSLLVSLSINQHTLDWNTSVQATFTIELPSSAQDSLPEVKHVLHQHPEIEHVHILDQNYVQKLMLQLGISGSNSPILIDFVVSKDLLTSFDADALLSDIQQVIPDSTLIKPVLVSPEALAIAERVQYAAFGFGLIMLIALCLILMFLIYAETQAHTRTISLFNLLGAPNYFISNVFRKYITWMLIKAFVLSLLLNGLFYHTLIYYINNDAFHILRSFSPLIWAYVIIGIPVLVICLAQLIVPITVVRFLKRHYSNSLHA